MMLFYVCARGEDGLDPGDDAGRLVSAHNAEEAAQMWSTVSDRDDAMVFRVPPVSPKPMVHDWHVSWAKRGAQCLLQ